MSADLIQRLRRVLSLIAEGPELNNLNLLAWKYSRETCRIIASEALPDVDALADALAALTAERDSLAAELAALKRQEPVAYQWRPKGGSIWNNCDREFITWLMSSPAAGDHETRAMYATPTAAGDAPLGYMTPAAVAAMPQAQGIVRGSAGDGYSVPVYVRAGDAPTANALRDLIETLEHGDSLKLAEVIERGLEALEGVAAGDAEALRDALRAWLTRNGLLRALHCKPAPDAATGNWWVVFAPKVIDGSSCEGYGKTEDAAIDAALAADAGRSTEGGE